ncbi:MAG: hypothetical protein P8X96_07220 [Desulfobacteraceae bacterium]
MDFRIFGFKKAVEKAVFIWFSRQRVPVPGIDGDGMHLHKDFIIARDRPLNFFQPEHLGRAVVVINDCFHIDAPAIPDGSSYQQPLKLAETSTKEHRLLQRCNIFPFILYSCLPDPAVKLENF